MLVKSDYSDAMSARSAIFVLAGALATKLPPFRGRTRLCLGIYRLLGLQEEHVIVRTTLTDPVQFEAQLDLHSWLQRLAFLTGSYEGETAAFICHLHKIDGRGGYFLDVGANIGLISLPVAKLAGTTAVSIEAVPDNAAALRTNVNLNQLENVVRVLNIGLGDTKKTVDIQVEGDLASGEGSGTANILADGSTYRCVRQQLEIKPLDSVYPRLVPTGCSVMKIDTDGYDLKVLEGGTQFLRRERPIIFGEFDAHCLSWHCQSSLDVERFARTIDYEVWRRLTPSWKFTDRLDHDSFQADLLLVPADRAHLLLHLLG
jgi:FkbM family methyltransferase